MFHGLVFSFLEFRRFHYHVCVLGVGKLEHSWQAIRTKLCFTWEKKVLLL